MYISHKHKKKVCMIPKTILTFANEGYTNVPAKIMPHLFAGTSDIYYNIPLVLIVIFSVLI